MSLCTCNEGVKNFGTPNCVGNLNRPAKLVFVDTIANSGTPNAILLADTLDDTYITGMIQTGDKTNAATVQDNSMRWFPTGVINKVNDTRADNNTFDLDGFQINTSKGVRTMAFTVVEGASPRMAEAYESLGCRDIAFYTFSVTGQIGGNDRTASQLKPFRIKKGTMKVIFQPENKENETPAMVMVSFDISDLEKDANISYIDYGNGDNDVQVDVLSYDGLIDVTMGAASSISTTGFTSVMTFDYGAVFDKEPFEGGVIADFTLYNETTDSAVTITTLTESPAGTYTPDFTAQTASDELTLTGFKEGYQFTAPLTIEIPA